VNWELLRHPLNWLIVILMLAIAGFAGHLLLSHLGVEPSSEKTGAAGATYPTEANRNDIAELALG
jgi:hypothetical protein